MVVVEEDRRVGLPVELFEHGSREAGVDLDISVVPRGVKAAVDRRRVRELPQVVLDEPEHRIRHDVVEPVVRLLLVRDETQSERRTVTCGLGERRPDERVILVGDRARDPRHVVQRKEPAQGRDEPAAAAPGGSLAVLVA